jgi:hypothetical protein
MTEARNRIAELEANFNGDNGFNWSNKYYATFAEYEAAEWLLNSSMWKEEGVERY